jgi:preprotein translocase SecE subunit
MAAVTKNSDGNEAMASEPEDDPQSDDLKPDDPKASEPSRKVPPTYPRGAAQPVGYRSPTAVTPRSKGYFAIYKKGQGYWTRMGTVAGAILIGLLTENFLWDEKENLGLHEHGGYILLAVFGAIYSLIGFHYLNKPTNVDFLIATDSEMKKVNWTSRKELIGSTRIVILFMLAIALVLFVYDLFFHTIFWSIGVLKTKPPFFH